MSKIHPNQPSLVVQALRDLALAAEHDCHTDEHRKLMKTAMRLAERALQRFSYYAHVQLIGRTHRGSLYFTVSQLMGFDEIRINIRFSTHRDLEDNNLLLAADFVVGDDISTITQKIEHAAADLAAQAERIDRGDL